jgi:Ca2+ transporting ATPase
MFLYKLIKTIFFIGETCLIKNNQNEDVVLFLGTQVMEGSGQMVVVAVGLNSNVGTISTLC